MSGFNLYDYSKAFFSDGAPVPVSKVLVKASPVFATAIVVEGNRDNGHEYAIQNGLPSGAFRKAYEGVVPSKGSTTLVHEKYARYSTASVVDVAVAEKGGNVAQIKADMLADKMEVTAQDMEKEIIYGNDNFLGLAGRFSKIATKGAGAQIVNAGGSTANKQTSAYIVHWEERKCFLFFPKGMKAGIQVYEFGGGDPVDALDSNGGTYPAYKTQCEISIGLGIQDFRYAARVANIEVSTTDTDAEKKAVLMAIKRGIGKIKSLQGGKTVVYVSRNLFDIITDALGDRPTVIVNQGGSNNVTGNSDHPDVGTNINGIPVMISDAIVETEAVVS